MGGWIAAFACTAAVAAGACAGPTDAAPPPSTAGRDLRDACLFLRCRPRMTVQLADETRTYVFPVAPTPYAGADVVFVLPGDDFFVSAEAKGETLSNFEYVEAPMAPKNVIHIQFAQKELPGGLRAMLLTIRSFFSRSIIYHAVMHHPARPRSEYPKTSTCPLGKVPVTEVWSHPIDMLLLRDFRFGDNSGTCAYY